MHEWEPMRERWNYLLRQSCSDTIFLTWEWLYTWAECYICKGRKLNIIAIYDKDELMGIAPLYINHINYVPFRLRQIEFLGSPETSSDYLDVFSKRGKEREVAKRVYKYLYDEMSSAWDILKFENMPSNSLFFANFSDYIKNDGKYFESQAGAFCPCLKLPLKKDVFFSELSPNRRKRYNYDMGVMKRCGEVQYTSSQPANGDNAIDNFLSLYKKRWGHNNTQFYLFLNKFISKSNGKGLISIDFLNVDGKDIAGLFFLRYRNVISLYLMATDTNYNKKISIGNILTGISIEKAINDKFSAYDFLKGNEEYKFYWTKEGKRCLNFYSYRRSLVTLMFTTKRMIKNIGKILLR
jgi:hypothetical protein